MRDVIIVLKFGSSVLTSPDHYPRAVLEIYQELRRGHKVVAVVSAPGETTEELLNDARERWGEPDPECLARLLETGEARSAAAMGLALDAAGVPARVLDPVQLDLATSEEVLDAEPLSFRPRAILAALQRVPVVVVPGFSGRRGDGTPALLGRGGSDLTALFLAHGLEAEECRLLKDVNGLLRVKEDGTLDHGTRYEQASYGECLRVGGPLVQPKAVEFAAARGNSFRIARCGDPTGTLAGPYPDLFATQRAPEPTRVALAGLGTVGLGVYRWLFLLREDFHVVGILVRDEARQRPADVHRELLTGDPEHLLGRGPDLVIEVMGGEGTAAELANACRDRGIPLVTANKQLLAGDPRVLDSLAAGGEEDLAASASVGGSVPALELVDRLARQGSIRKLEGVINGTCNFILDRLQAGQPFREALTEAQLAGMAEADPTLDISGLDCVFKLSLLATRAFGRPVPPGTITREGLDEGAEAQARHACQMGNRLKLVATAEWKDGEVEASVTVKEVGPDHPLAACQSERNALLVTVDSGEQHVVHGKGAGCWPTTVSVMADVLQQRREQLEACRNPSARTGRRSA
jgi:homoserine dehydrogenase